MSGFHWKAEGTHFPRIIIILLSLLASIILTPPETLECGSLFPDENLEIFGICKVPQKQDPASYVFICFSSGSSLLHFKSHYLLFFEIFFFQPTNIRIDLVTTLRC